MLTYQVKWQPAPDGVFREPVINYQAVAAATTQVQQKSKYS